MVLRSKALKLSLAEMNGLLATLLLGVICSLIFIDSMRGALLATTIFFTSIVGALAYLNWRNNSGLRYGLAICLIAIVYAVVAALFNDVYLAGFFTKFILLIVSIVVLSSIGVSPRAGARMGVIALIFLGLLFFQSFNYYLNYFEVSSVASLNPNSLAIAVLMAFVIIDRCPIISNRLHRLLLVAVSGISIFQYGSRSVLLGLAVYLLVSFIVRQGHYRTRKIIFLIAVAFALIFPFIYVNNSNNHEYNPKLDETAGLLDKEAYSGRQDVWEGSIEHWGEHGALVGSANTEFVNSLPARSLHNMYIDTVYHLGVPLLLILFVVMYTLMVRKKDFSVKSYAVIITILVYGNFESTLVSGTYVGMLMMMAFINFDAASGRLSTGLGRRRNDSHRKMENKL